MRQKPELRQIPIEKLKRGRFQPRRNFDSEALQELADSIKSAGLIQPLVVRPFDKENYEIVAGERRWRASQLAGLDTLPCLVNHYTDEQTAAVTAIENINRVDLNPIEEAQAYQRLIDEFNYLHEEVAAVVGKSRAKITNSLRLLKLDERVQHLLIKGEISEGHGKTLAGLSQKEQWDLANKIIKYAWNVRKIEQEVKNLQEGKNLIDAKKDPDINLLEQALADHIGCKVTINFADRSGQLKIDFHNLEILEGVLAKMGFNVDGV